MSAFSGNNSLLTIAVTFISWNDNGNFVIFSESNFSFDDLHPTPEDLSNQTLNKENVDPFGTTKSPRDEKVRSC